MDEQEFSQRVMVHSGKFYRYSLKLLGNADDARDVVQDLYLKLWSMRESLPRLLNIEAFATTIVRNLCLDRLKRYNRQKAYQGNGLAQVQAQPEEGEGGEAEHRLNLIRHSVKQLPQIQQRVFLMRDFEEMEFEAISLELGLTPENVRVVLSRARKRVKEIIDSMLSHR
jgi:RNA polymerase sigma-70 factor (ECF subfamily)